MIEENDDDHEESNIDEVNDDNDDDNDGSNDDDGNDVCNDDDATTNNEMMAQISTYGHDAGPYMIRLGVKLPLFLDQYVDIMFRCLPKQEYLVLETDEEACPPKVQWLFNVLAIAARELQTGRTEKASLTRKLQPFTKSSLKCFFKLPNSKKNVTFGGTIIYTDITRAFFHPNTTFGFILKALFSNIMEEYSEDIKLYINTYVDMFPLNLLNNA